MITKKRKSDLADDNLSTPHVQVFEDVDGENLPKVDADYVADLEKQLKRLQDQRDDQRDEQLLYLDQRPNQSQVSDGPIEVKVDSIPLPDPALEPAEFAAAVSRRAQITMENAKRRDEFDAKRKNDIDGKINNLWSNFNSDYEEYAGDKKKIEYAAQQVLAEAQRRGIDPQRYMFTTQNKFFRDVAKQYDEIFGAPDIDDTLDEDIAPRGRNASNPSSRRQPRDRNRQEDDEGRSAGIFGGNESGGRPGRRVEQDDKATDMISELQAVQRKMGLY